MEITSYFRRKVLENPNRIGITREMCEAVVAEPEGMEVQPDRRTRYYAKPEGRELYLMVLVTEDGTAMHNAFFDSNYTRKKKRSDKDEG